MKTILAGLLVLATLGCGASPAEETGDDVGALGATGTSGGATELPNSIHWVRNSAEYQAAVRQAYRLAAANVDAAVARDRLAAGSWGVVLDADETVVDNSTYNMERAFSAEGSTSSSWNDYVRSETGKPIAAALPFLRRVQAAGGRVFIVTSRAADHCPFTENTLRKSQIPFDVLLCKAPGDADKNARFRAIEEGRAPSPFGATRVVLYVGDNILDFPNLDQTAATSEEKLAEFGERYVLVPNPMYGSWEKTPRR